VVAGGINGFEEEVIGMNKIRKQNVPPQRGSRVPLEKIVIRPDLEHQWIDALGLFAGMMRAMHGFRYVVHIEEEECFVNSAGELIISAKITETLQMAIPPGAWEWKV